MDFIPSIAMLGQQKFMEIIKLNYKDQNYRDELLTHLKGQVFHLTTERAFIDINKSGYIFNSKDSRFPSTWNPAKTFGGIRGYICLFDLRDKTEDIINDTLSKYDFLNPTPWFEEYEEPFFKLYLAYLILNPAYYNKLIPNEAAIDYEKETSRNFQYIPTTECWFENELPIGYINKLLLVHIKIKAKQGNLAGQIRITALKKVIN
jgi:hypothetical protein